jgi:hypothetical protein
MLGRVDEAVRNSAGMIKAGTVKRGQRRVQCKHVGLSKVDRNWNQVSGGSLDRLCFMLVTEAV